jgi:hypothetical protein
MGTTAASTCILGQLVDVPAVAMVDAGQDRGQVLGGGAVEVQVHLLPGGQRPRLRAILHCVYGCVSVHLGRERGGARPGPVTFVPALAGLTSLTCVLRRCACWDCQGEVRVAEGSADS